MTVAELVAALLKLDQTKPVLMPDGYPIYKVITTPGAVYISDEVS